MSIRRYYNSKKNTDSYLLSLLTPYIILKPVYGISDADRQYVSKCVKSISIKQDSDVILFNKIIANVQFVPQDVFSGTSKNKYNFMNKVDDIFNLSSLWVLQCGWTGPNKLKNIIQSQYSKYKTYRTLLKTNIQLIKNKYTGTLQFCARSFQNFRDLVFPMDSFIERLSPGSFLVQKDWLLDAQYKNQFKAGQQPIDTMSEVGKKTQQLDNQVKDLKNNLAWDLKKINDNEYTQKDKSRQDTLKLYSDGYADKQKKIKQLLGKKYCTLRYLLTVIYDYLFSDSSYSEYKIRIRGQQWNDSYSKHMMPVNYSQTNDKDSYFIPYKVHYLNIANSGKQILGLNNYNKKGANIDYYLYNNGKYSTDKRRKGIYAFNDRADTLIDLYAFNKKLYQSNILQCLSKIDDFKMRGFPRIRIVYDKISNINKDSNNGQICLVRWSFPIVQDSDSINIVYDRANQLYQNLTIQTPTNDQMLNINELSVQTEAEQSDTQKIKALKGIAKSIKKISIPTISDDVKNNHSKLKDRFYKKIVNDINGGTIKPSVDKIKNGNNFAGMIELKGVNLYYFSSTQSFKQSTMLGKYIQQKGSDQAKDIVEKLQKYITRSAHQDISKKLISYLSQSLNVSVDIHGTFNIPVFYGNVTLNKFPGPLLKNGKNYLNGDYLITSQQTTVDRTTIKTNLKLKRVDTTLQ